MQLLVDRDLALKYAEEKAMEVEHLHMDLEGSHPSTYTTYSHTYMDSNAHYLMEEPYERFEHEDESNLEVFEKKHFNGGCKPST